MPRAPGPFAFEDTDYLRDILVGAGFSEIDVVAHHGLQPIGGDGGTPEEAVSFAMSSLAAGHLMRDQSEYLRLRVAEDLMAAFGQHYVEGRGVMMEGKAWMVTAVA